MTKILAASIVTLLLLTLAVLSAPTVVSAQSTVTCSVSGTLNLTGTENVIQCFGANSLLWTVNATSQTSLDLEYYPTATIFPIPVDPQTQTQECVSGTSACATLVQGNLSANGSELPITLTGTD